MLLPAIFRQLPLPFFLRNFAPVKFLREIAAYLSIALLALANMGAVHNVATQQDLAPVPSHDQSWLVPASDGIPLYCLTEQLQSAVSCQGNGSAGFKLPIFWAVAKPFFLNAPSVSGFHYFQLSRFLLIGFSTTDVIFPFHQFW